MPRKWELESMTIFVTWQLRVTVYSILGMFEKHLLRGYQIWYDVGLLFFDIVRECCRGDKRVPSGFMWGWHFTTAWYSAEKTHHVLYFQKAGALQSASAAVRKSEFQKVSYLHLWCRFLIFQKWNRKELPSIFHKSRSSKDICFKTILGISSLLKCTTNLQILRQQHILNDCDVGFSVFQFFLLQFFTLFC